ncbi:MAG TPA: PqqD family protein [Candidatus Polarisedimenticolia bacterium]|nr:PqqD family protein [Candidatus Polarisedimenticolia bacterium]
MDLETVLTKNPNAAYRIYDGQATVVLPDQAEVDVLNEVGSKVWDQIDGKRTLRQILDSVLEEFDTTPDQARRDILEFVAELREHQMVR